MMRHACLTVTALLLLLGGVARGEGFDVSLELSNGKDSAAAKNKAGGADLMAHRAVLEAATDGSFTMKWKVVGTGGEEAKDVLVHFYVVKVAHQGQAPPALEPERVVLEGAVRMDFPKGEAASGSQPFRLDEPGIYLVRVEAGGDPDKPGTADVAELELVAK
jgi:hypothetical protein